MKIKNLLLVCSLFLAGGVVATGAEQANNVKAENDSFTIGFKSNTNDASQDLQKNVLTQLDTSLTTIDSSYLSCTAGSKVYAGKNGLKFGSSSVRGSMTLQFTDSYNVTSIVVNAMRYGSDTAQLTIAGDGVSYTSGNLTSALANYTYSLPSATALNSLKFGISGKRGYIKSITIAYTPVESETFNVSFDAAPSSFIDGKGGDVTCDNGVESSISLPSQSDLVDNGLFDNGFAQVTGWKKIIDEEVFTYGFGESAVVSSRTIFSTTHEQLKTDLTIAEANELGLSGDSVYAYSATGTISTIDSAYDSSYGNITVTISDGENSIKCFRLSGGEDLYVGTKIKVTGTLTSYNGAAQFAQGATYAIVEEASAESVFQDAQTTTKLTASYDSTIESSEEGAYSYEVNTKVFNGYGQETLLGEKMWIANSDKGTPGSVDNTYKRGQQFGSSSAAPKYLTLTSVEEFVGVTEIIVDANAGTSTTVELSVTVGGVQIGDTVAKINNVTTTLGSYTFTSETPLNGRIEITYTQTSGTKAVYFKGVSVSYSSQVKSYAVADASIGFASLIDAVAYDENANYGILVVPTDELGSNTVASYVSTDVNALVASLTAANVRVANYPCEPVKVDANGDADENGEFYQFGVLFSNCLANIDFSLTAVAYMEVNGQVYLTSNQSSYSLRSLAQAYIDAGTMVGNPDAIGVLEAIVNY